jgi:Kef-type K+ transport system membrane component KefB
MLAIAVVMLTARLLGSLAGRIGQPPVMGEVIAGILLGPTLLGALLPGAESYLFPFDVVALIAGAASIGLAFYMFLVGLELDPHMLAGKARPATAISVTSVALPFVLGAVVSVPLWHELGGSIALAPLTKRPDEVAFAVFVGVSMSITAFPVLARILIERRMIRRPIGAIALASAAVDDVLAWTLLAVATAIATATASGNVAAGITEDVLRIIGLTALFALAMALFGRRLLSRVATAFDEAGHVPLTWVVGLFVAVPLSAFVTQWIGVAAIFGAFVLGLAMPHRSDLGDDVSRRLYDFVTIVLLPLFFVVTGLRTEIGQLHRRDWLICAGLTAIAIVGKWGGAMLAARGSGYTTRESAAIGALMNTRGLTELIVLNIGLTIGVIPQTLFTVLVIMAIVTTLMAAPLLRVIDPRGTFSAGPEDELQAAEPAAARDATIIAPERALLVAPQDDRNTAALVAIGEQVARAHPVRELVLARLLGVSRTVTGLAHDDRRLQSSAIAANEMRAELIARGVPARSVAFVSAHPGDDLVRLTEKEPIDLLLIDGSRPLLGGGVPKGDVGEVLRKAPCDVAVLVERPNAPRVGPGSAVVVPFGGAEHDWAALELGARIAADQQAPLRLVGAAARLATGERDASRLLADAALVVQQIVEVDVQPELVQPGHLDAATVGAGLLVVGLSDRWRQEGLGAMRTELARSAAAPILFVRRGTRPGVLGTEQEGTRFSWSRA